MLLHRGSQDRDFGEQALHGIHRACRGRQPEDFTFGLFPPGRQQDLLPQRRDDRRAADFPDSLGKRFRRFGFAVGDDENGTGGAVPPSRDEVRGPGQKIVPVSVGRKPVDGVKFRLNDNLFARDPQVRLAVDQPANV